VMKRPALYIVFKCFHVQRLAVASDAWLVGRQVALPVRNLPLGVIMRIGLGSDQIASIKFVDGRNQ
jgi:hypothetical protein